jgi:hypothetical protein
MSPYSRSAKVLIYLVASMTVATALLLWIEHVVVPVDPHRGGPTMSKPVADALRTNRPIQPGTWDEIVISYRDRVPTASAVALASPSQPLPYHFVIDASGQIRSLPTWQEQQPGVSGTDVVSRAVHICLAGQSDLTAVPADQWDSLVSLIRQVRAKCNLPAKAVRLDPQSDVQVRPNLSQQAQRLRQMLLAADIID